MTNSSGRLQHRPTLRRLFFFTIMNINDFIYLFLTEPCRISMHHRYEVSARKEPGYAEAWLKAYNFAFSSTADNLTPEFIQKIHQIAMKYDSVKDNGIFREEKGEFTIAALNKDNNNQPEWAPRYNASAKGFEEFVQYWMKPNTEWVHSVTFLTDGNFYLLDNSVLWFSKTEEAIESKAFNPHTHTASLMNHLADPCYGSSIEVFPNLEKKKFKSSIMQLMTGITDGYDSEIKKAKDERDKIKVIVTHLQRIDQLHPFREGNVRTCYILLNKLLKDNKLSLSILMNPNRFDCCSVDELIDMVVQGQKHYQQLITHTDGPLVFDSPQETLKVLKSLTCPPQKMEGVPDALLRDFNKIVLEIDPEKKVASPTKSGSSSSSSSSFSQFFTTKPIFTTTQLIGELKSLNCTLDPPILEQLEKNNANVALRMACYYAKDSRIIITMLKYKAELGIDLNQSSTNGNTARDWLKLNKNIEAKDIETINLMFAQHINKI